MSTIAKPAAPESQVKREIAPGIASARQAFRDDLPRLLQDHPGQWVAYHGPKCVGFSGSQRALYKQCLDHGLPLEEVLVCSVEPDETIVVDD